MTQFSGATITSSESLISLITLGVVGPTLPRLFLASV